MSKYDPLGVYLKERSTPETPMTFSEIEAVIGAPLPPAAGRHAAWWSNNPSNNVMTKVWLDAGYRSERIDLSSRKLVFKRSSRSRPIPGPALRDPQEGPESMELTLYERLKRRLAGSVKVAAGCDPTSPTGVTWDAEV